MRDIGTSLKYKTLFISDIHLGTRGCKADFLLDFLKHTESDKLYLVGDIIDGWRLKKYWFWPQAHNDVVQKLLRKARKGTDVIVIPGNHDSFGRDFLDHEFGLIKVRRDDIHVTVSGQRFLVMHGDECDDVMKYAKWLAVLGDHAYAAALALNNCYNTFRRVTGRPYWSLSKYLKHKVKNAVQFISNFEETMTHMARERGVDGVVCGHIHHAEIRTIDGIAYLNDGDWVESCTALAEHYDGRWEIIDWAEMRGVLPTEAASENDDLIEPSLPLPLPLPLPSLSRTAETTH